MYLVPVGKAGNEGYICRYDVGGGAYVVRKWLVAPESRMAHRLMVAALVVIVLRRTEAASAYLWVGVGQ